MSRFLDLTGRIFGRLSVEKRIENHVTSGGNQQVIWSCLCSCGERVKVSSNSLLQNKTKSCGCLSMESARQLGLANKRHGGYAESSTYSDRVKHNALVNIKERARRRGYESDLSIEDLPELTDVCPVLGLRYNRGSLKDKNASPSIDRRNTNLPYLKKYKDNLVFISHRANRIKTDASIDEIEKVLLYMKIQSDEANNGHQA